MNSINTNTQSISGTFKQRAVWGFIATAVIITISISALRYMSYQKRVENIETEYLSGRKSLVKQEVLRTSRYIQHMREGAEKKFKVRLKSRIYEAHDIATKIYKHLDGKLPDAEIKKIIIETLRPLRSFKSKAHYYIISSDGKLQLQPRKPEFRASEDWSE